MTQEQIDQLELQREMRYAFARYWSAKHQLDACLWTGTSMAAITPALDAFIAARNMYKLLWCDAQSALGFERAHDCRSGVATMVEACVPALRAAFEAPRAEVAR